MYNNKNNIILFVAIGEVPKYMFSPPHTRSKTTTSDLRRWLLFN